MEGETDVLPDCRALFRRSPSEFASPLRTPSAWHEDGVLCELAGDLVAASDRYLTALALGGPLPQVVFDLAYALAALGQIEEAIARYRQVLQLDPHRVDAWVNLGDLLLTQGHRPEAIVCFRQALALEPKDAAAHYNLADAFDRAGEAGLARLHFAAFVSRVDSPAEQAAHARRQLENARGK